MKITMYELLGMVKDGNIPKKIYYLGHYYTWKENDEDYQKEDGLMLFGNSKINYILDTPVEIIEEEKKIPEKLKTYKEIDNEEHYANILKVSKNGECEIDEATSVIVDKINEIIDYLKSKGE